MVKPILLAIMSVALLSACGGDSEQNGSDPSSAASSSSSSSTATSSSSSSVVFPQPDVTIPGDPIAGQVAYARECALCHGDDGEGISQYSSPALIGCSVCDNPNSLASYIDSSMPPGSAAAALKCAGDCAVNVSAYIITEFNSKDTSACVTSNPEPSPSEFKRLSRNEYAYSLKDLLQLSDTPDVSAVPDDPSIHNFKTVAKVQTIQAGHLGGYLSVATEQAEALMSDSTRRNAVLACNYSDNNCLGSFIERFGRLAYRRPLDAEEKSRLEQYVLANSNSVSDRYVLALQLMLTSPNFIYRVEVGNSPEGLSTLSAYELVSRMSFALWGRGPNSELLDRAANGELNTASGLRAVAEDMLTDARAKENLEGFFEQWLATNLLSTPVDKPQNWYTGILDDMRGETNELLGEYVWQNKDFMQIFTENHSYLTPGLADYYGLPRPQSSLGPVQIPAGSPRTNTGILTHAANMFAKTDGDLVAIRGNWLRKTFLCKELHLPNGIEDIINGKFAGYTAMEIIEARNTDLSCERCHSQIDPIGVAFAPYSREGLFDPSVNLGDFPISPGFPDAQDPSIQTVQDMAHALSQMPEVGACIADRLFLYTRNHEPKENDHCAVEQANFNFQNSGRQFASLLLSLVEDPSFRVRVAPEPTEEDNEPEPAQNVALGKPVNTSAAQDGNPGIRITDDNTSGESRWSAQYFPQQATIDLGSIHTIVQTEVYPYFDRAYHYTIEVSSNGSNYTRVVNRSNNVDGGNVISDLFAPIDARYVRISITGVTNDSTEWASLRELRVFGTRQ